MDRLQHQRRMGPTCIVSIECGQEINHTMSTWYRPTGKAGLQMEQGDFRVKRSRIDQGLALGSKSQTMSTYSERDLYSRPRVSLLCTFNI